MVNEGLTRQPWLDPDIRSGSWSSRGWQEDRPMGQEVEILALRTSSDAPSRPQGIQDLRDR